MKSPQGIIKNMVIPLLQQNGKRLTEK